MQKNFISYQQGLSLKELGFDEPCIAIALWENDFCLVGDGKVWNNSDIDIIYLPLYEQSFRWFREKHGLACWIYPSPQIGETIKWCYDTTDFKKMSFTPPIFDTYEDAQLACLKKLIEIVKDKNGNGL